MTVYHAGWDFFTPSPGTEDTMHCCACGEEMEVQRNVFGPTGYVEAVGGRMRQRQDPAYRVGHLHDVFTCKRSGQTWHTQVIALREEQSETSSARLKSVLEEEIQQILTTRQATI